MELVVDATGNGRAIQDGLGRVGPAGTFLQFGVADYATQVTIDRFSSGGGLKTQVLP